MPEKLKDLFFSNTFIQNLGEAIQVVDPRFDAMAFNRQVLADHWEDRALKQKMRHITHALKATLPGAAGKATWFIDGKPYRKTSWPFSTFWQLTPGTHRIKVVANKRASREVEITVY